MPATNRSTRVWSLIGLLAGIAIGVSYLLDWLGLSVDVLARDEIVVSATVVDGAALPATPTLIVLAGVVVVFSVLALLRPASGRLAGLLVTLGGLAAVGYAAYVYLGRVDVLTQAIVDDVASEEAPAAAVERVVDLAIRAGGVEVEPQTGLLVAAAAGLVALLAGLVLAIRAGAGAPVGAAAEGGPADAGLPEELPTEGGVESLSSAGQAGVRQEAAASNAADAEPGLEEGQSPEPRVQPPPPPPARPSDVDDWR